MFFVLGMSCEGLVMGSFFFRYCLIRLVRVLFGKFGCSSYLVRFVL